MQVELSSKSSSSGTLPSRQVQMWCSGLMLPLHCIIAEGNVRRSESTFRLLYFCHWSILPPKSQRIASILCAVLSWFKNPTLVFVTITLSHRICRCTTSSHLLASFLHSFFLLFLHQIMCCKLATCSALTLGLKQ